MVAKYQNHKLFWLCNCIADANNDLCAHKIAAQGYLIYAQLSDVKPEVETPEMSGDENASCQDSSNLSGLSQLTERQKEILKEMVNFHCEDCHKHQNEVGTLEIHRMKRGAEGGKYIPSNIRVLCKSCHDLYDY